MNHAEDEALRQRLADENLARASRVELPRARFVPPPPEYLGEFGRAAKPSERLAPDREYLAPPVPTSAQLVDQQERRAARRFGIGTAMLMLGGLMAVAAGLGWL